MSAAVPGCGGQDEAPDKTGAKTSADEAKARAAQGAHAASRRGSAAVVVERVVDGDTLDLTNGSKVRLLQIDTPETTEGECYSGRAEGRLAALVHPGEQVGLRADPALDRTDRYGRLLRYVYRDGRNVNLALVRRGAATVWFYQGDRGRFAQRLLGASRRARHAKRGLWGACPGTPFNPEQGADTGGGSSGSRSRDKDCSDFSSQAEAQRFFKAHGGPNSDPDRLDANHNGIACESL